MGPHRHSGRTDVRHWPGMRSEYSWIPSGECAGQTRPGQVGVSFSTHRGAVYETNGRTIQSDIAGGAVFVTGPDPIVWTRVQETTEALEIYPDPGLSAFEPKLAAHDGTVLAIATILKRVHATGSSLTDIAASTLAHRLADHLGEQRSGAAHQPGRPTGRLDRITVDRVTEFVEASLSTELTLDRLATVAQLSPFHFARAFKATTGLAPHQFVMARRVERAKTLLLESTSSVVDVAYAVGLSNVSHFRRVFRRHTGALPGELREWNRKIGPSGPRACARWSPGDLDSLPVPHLFLTGDTPLAARVYRNTDDLLERQPAVIITGSWLTVKEQMAHHYAEALSARGYTVFTFDFSGFGESGGTPRQAEVPARKIADIAAAARYVSSLSFVRPGGVGYLAVCASAQYTLAAVAAGAPIDSYVSVAGWYHDTESVTPFYGGIEGVNLRVVRAREAFDAYLRSGEVRTVPAYEDGNDRAGMFFTLDYYADPTRGAIPEWTNEMAEFSWIYWLTFDGLSAASRVSVPTLFVHGDDCVLPGNAKSVHEALAGPKELVWADGTQTDFYDQPTQVALAVDAADEHFRETLAP